MATHAWLRHRAQRLQDEKLAQGMNQMQDYKQIDVLARYYNTHLRAYNKAFADLLRLKRFQMQVKKTKPCWSDALRTCKFGSNRKSAKRKSTPPKWSPSVSSRKRRNSETAA